jgi:hypothetical protein
VLNAKSQIRRAICDWIREDAPLAVKMSVMPEHVAALARRLSDAKEQGGDHGPA